MLGWRIDGRRKRLLYQSGMGLGALVFFLTVYHLLHQYLFTADLSLWNLPALGEALSRAWRGLFGAGLVLLAAQVLGAGLCWLLRWHPDDWREGLLYRTATGLGGVSYLSLGLATLGLYRPVSVQILITVILSVGSLWVVYCLVRVGRSKWKVEGLASLVATANCAGDKVWKAIALLAVLIAFVGALAPEIEYDALWYHLWLPKLWLTQGRPVDLVAEYISLYPLTWDLIFGAGLVLGGPVAAKLLHFACLQLTGLLTYQLTKRFVPQASPWLAVALFFTVPIVLWEATTAYIDLAPALYVGLVVYALLRYVERRRWQWLGLAALNLGLALATKHLALFVLPLATGGLALRLWLEGRNLRRALVPALLLGGLSLLLPLPWYLRSWLASGNPVFPDLYVVFGASPPERWNEISEMGWRHFEAQFGRPRTAFNQLTLLWDMTVHAARYGGTLGPSFLLLLPALALLCRRSRVIPWLVAFVLIYIGLWSSPLNGLEMRFLIPLTPLLAVLAAEASDRLALLLRSTLAGWGGKAFQGGLAVLLLLNLPPFISLHEGDRVMWDGWLTHVIRRIPISVVIGLESQQDYLARSVPSYAAWHYINTHLPADARVLTFSGGDHFYSERERIWSDALVAHPAVWGAPRGQEEQALENLHRLDVLYILFDKQQLDSLEPGTLAIAQPSVLASWYDLVYEDDRFALYRIQWEQVMPRPSERGDL
jgi:hypothetical protein